MARILTMTVNGNQIKFIPFVEEYVYQVANGIVASLKDTGAIKTLELKLDGGEVALNLNGKEVPVNVFVTRIITSTMAGMVSTLKGAEGKMKTLELKISQ
jgi:hypothetical protein